jgi:hypothetical protein
MVSSVTSAGRAGSWTAGPRVRVRRGRRAKLPSMLVSHKCTCCYRLGGCTNQLLVGLIEEDGVVGL